MRTSTAPTDTIKTTRKSRGHICQSSRSHSASTSAPVTVQPAATTIKAKNPAMSARCRALRRRSSLPTIGRPHRSKIVASSETRLPQWVQWLMEDSNAVMVALNSTRLRGDRRQQSPPRARTAAGLSAWTLAVFYKVCPGCNHRTHESCLQLPPPVRPAGSSAASSYQLHSKARRRLETAAGLPTIWAGVHSTPESFAQTAAQSYQVKQRISPTGKKAGLLALRGEVQRHGSRDQGKPPLLSLSQIV